MARKERVGSEEMELSISHIDRLEMVFGKLDFCLESLNVDESHFIERKTKNWQDRPRLWRSGLLPVSKILKVETGPSSHMSVWAQASIYGCRFRTVPNPNWYSTSLGVKRHAFQTGI